MLCYIRKLKVKGVLKMKNHLGFKQLSFPELIDYWKDNPYVLAGRTLVGGRCENDNYSSVISFSKDGMSILSCRVARLDDKFTVDVVEDVTLYSYIDELYYELYNDNKIHVSKHHMISDVITNELSHIEPSNYVIYATLGNNKLNEVYKDGELII